MAAVADSRMFGTLSETAGSADSGLLRVVIDDQADMGDAAAKGFGTGLTFGLAGSLVTDVYVCTASYTVGGKTVETTVQHALHSKPARPRSVESSRSPEAARSSSRRLS
jgi:hypothetical protein